MDIPGLLLTSCYTVIHTQQVSEERWQDFLSQKGSLQKNESFFCHEVTQVQRCPPQFEVYPDFVNLLCMKNILKHMTEMLRINIIQKVPQGALQMN